ncbi:hypothetical protein [Pedobacter flavus]|uniref:Uncharacterized protein n=1 Tax=Pedobacter flavus TaxID=3113906 RepID=A0ABU7H2K0_9SPHI|nr:hypothetical protein [Pedobacter sp. VNH31]MEE1885544.1 hypothetical protein [Pedobacter sp. VNH31]
MRIIAELPHPDCKITIFNMNQKYIVKLEQGPLEQSYKISELDLAGGGVNDVFEIIDDAFIQEALQHFSQMRLTFHNAYKRNNF